MRVSGVPAVSVSALGAGRYCETDVDGCLSSPCLNNATCDDLVDSVRCRCLEGFTGRRCELTTTTTTTTTTSSSWEGNRGSGLESPAVAVSLLWTWTGVLTTEVGVCTPARVSAIQVR